MNQTTEENVSSPQNQFAGKLRSASISQTSSPLEANMHPLQEQLVSRRKADGKLMYNEQFFLPRTSELDEDAALLRLVSYVESLLSGKNYWS